MSSFEFPTVDTESIQERFKDALSGTPKQTKDTRFYVLTKDQSGSGSSVIRFLPGVRVNGKEKLPYTVVYRHNLHLKGGTFLSCLCPTTLGHKCPICEWNRTRESEWVRQNNTYRKKKYISNVLIIDEATPELIGEVRMMEYGPQIMKILEKKLYPPEIGGKKKEPMIYYDWHKGANFELILNADKSLDWPTWDNSGFLDQSSIMDFLDEKGIDPEKIFNKLFDTEEVVKHLEYPDYEDLSRDLQEWCERNNLNDTNVISSNDTRRASELQNVKSSSVVDFGNNTTPEYKTKSVEDIINEVKSTKAPIEEVQNAEPTPPITENDSVANFRRYRDMAKKNGETV